VRTAYSITMSRLCVRSDSCGIAPSHVLGRADGSHLSELVSTFIYRFGYFESDLSTLFARYLKPGMTVFDIGPHYGYMTLLCATAVGATGSVHAFEADAEAPARC